MIKNDNHLSVECVYNISTLTNNKGALISTKSPSNALQIFSMHLDVLLLLFYFHVSSSHDVSLILTPNFKSRMQNIFMTLWPAHLPAFRTFPALDTNHPHATPFFKVSGRFTCSFPPHNPFLYTSIPPHMWRFWTRHTIILYQNDFSAYTPYLVKNQFLSPFEASWKLIKKVQSRLWKDVGIALCELSLGTPLKYMPWVINFSLSFLHGPMNVVCDEGMCY